MHISFVLEVWARPCLVVIYMPAFSGMEFNSGVSDAVRFLLEIFSRNATNVISSSSVNLNTKINVNNYHYDFIPNVSVVYVLELITHFQ